MCRAIALLLATIKIKFQFKNVQLEFVIIPRLLSVENNQFEGENDAVHVDTFAIAVQRINPQ